LTEEQPPGPQPPESTEMPVIRVSREVLNTLAALARTRRAEIPDVLAEAIGLEIALVEAKRDGHRMGVLIGSKFSDIIPLLDQVGGESEASPHRWTQAFPYPWTRGRKP
jgi:hypothetical protein